jgi:uncharacterized protein (TIGR03435 family)
MAMASRLSRYFGFQFPVASCQLSVWAWGGCGQAVAPPSGESRLTFDVASIRPSLATEHGYEDLKVRADGYTATYVPVKMLIAYMYRVPARQIIGGPGWLKDDRYDVEAKADGRHSVEELNTMFQNMLVDRFHLRFHIETKEANAYVLTIDKGGSKMKVNGEPQSYDMPVAFGGPGVWNGRRVAMPYFCWLLSQNLQGDERPVVDLTGLTGFYDFRLSFLTQGLSQEQLDQLSAEARDRPSLFEALREQLGLKLAAGKGPVQYFVIDRVDRPSAN